MRYESFCTWDIQIGPFAACLADFVPQFFQFPDLYTGAPISYYPREGKMRKMDETQSFCTWDQAGPNRGGQNHPLGDVPGAGAVLAEKGFAIVRDEKKMWRIGPNDQMI